MIYVLLACSLLVSFALGLGVANDHPGRSLVGALILGVLIGCLSVEIEARKED